MKKIIGFRLKNLRKTRGLKREGLAKIIGVSVSAIRDWEQGIHSFADGIDLQHSTDVLGVRFS